MSVRVKTRYLVPSALIVACGITVYVSVLRHRSAQQFLLERTLADSFAASAAASMAHSTPIRVAIFDFGQAGTDSSMALWEILSSDPGFSPEFVDSAAVRNKALAQFDVVIFPGGSGSEQASFLGEEGKSAVREYVHDGGGYVGICGGAFLAASNYDWSLALINARTLTGEIDIPGLGARSMASRGAGVVEIRVTDAGERVFGDCPDVLEIQYSGGPVLSPAGSNNLSQYISLAVYHTEIAQFEPQQGTMIGTPAILAASYGEGRVIIFSPHPEMTDGLDSLVKRSVLATAEIPTVDQ